MKELRLPLCRQNLVNLLLPTISHMKIDIIDETNLASNNLKQEKQYYGDDKLGFERP